MATPLQAGTARANITPPLGISLQGLFEDVRARDVLDELHANALVIDDGATEAALVSVDVCAIPAEACREIARLASALTGIPELRIFVTATHTHAGPSVGMTLDGIYELWPDYISHFKRQAASAVRLAQLRKQPARLAAGLGENRAYSFNRRLRRPDGSPVMNFIDDKASLRGAVPTGAADSQVAVLRFEDEKGAPIAYVVNYANHNNAQVRPLISADYAGVMAGHLRSVFGPQLGVLFLPGAAGNVNWIDHLDPGQMSPALYQKIGRSLAGTVLEIDAHLRPVDRPTLSVRGRTLRIPERPYCDYDVTVDGTFGGPELTADFFNAYRKAHERDKDQPLPVHDVDVRVMAFGDAAALATNPVELFAEYGLAIKAGSPYPFTLVAELTNGAAGYAPTPEAFAFGGYEVRKMPEVSYLARDAGQRIAQASLELLSSQQ